MSDKMILKFTYWCAVVALGIALIAMVIDADKQVEKIEQQLDKQQLKIDAQSREISRLEQTNKVLANQAKNK